MQYWQPEMEAYLQGLESIAGVDEVGKGCLAGPVYAAAVILPRHFNLPGLTDSKKLTALKREELDQKIRCQALALEIAWVDVSEIDRINIFQAALKAMAAASLALKHKPQIVLVDGKFPLPISLPQKTLIQGDSRSASIAAASIVAKVARDAYMTKQEKYFPAFSFARHKGYGTPRHHQELLTHGPTVLHRRSFAPVRALC